MLKRIGKFLREDLWAIPYNEYALVKSFLVKTIRVLFAAVRGFFDDECYVHASALTYFSIFSIVPVLAVVFGIAKGFGFDQTLQAQLLERFPEHEAAVQQVIQFTYSLLAHAEGGLIAGIGVAILLALVILVLGNIEHALNLIWKVKHSRSVGRKFADYFALMILGPVFLVVSSSSTVLLLTRLIQAAPKSDIIETVRPVIAYSFSFVPVAVTCLMFTLLYILLPNTRVPWRFGFLAGIIAGLAYHLIQWAYIHFQIGVSSYGAIYGSFAAVPLFLLSLQFSWIIFLVGAEIAYHAENEAYHYTSEVGKSCKVTRRILGTYILARYVEEFQAGKQPMSILKIAKELGIPLPLAREIVTTLAETSVLAEIKNSESEFPLYQPARSIDAIDLERARLALDVQGEERVRVNRSSRLHKIEKAVEDFEKEIQVLPSNKQLRNL